jgi:hypothetical protein
MRIDVNRLATAILAIIVVIVGGIVCIIDPASLPFRQYIEAVALGAGLLGIGYGLDSQSKP